MKFITTLLLLASSSVFAGSYNVHYKFSANDPAAELLLQGKTAKLAKDCADRPVCQGIVKNVIIVDQFVVEMYSETASGTLSLELEKVAGFDIDPVGTKYPVDSVSVKKNTMINEVLYPFIDNEQVR